MADSYDCSRPLTPGHVLHVTCSSADTELASVRLPCHNGLSRLAVERGGDTLTLSVINHWKMWKLKIKILSSTFSSRHVPDRSLESRRLAIRSHDDVDDDSRSQSTNLKSCQVQSKFLASKDSFHPLYMSLLPGGGAGTRQSFISSFSLSRSDHVLFEYAEFL